MEYFHFSGYTSFQNPNFPSTPSVPKRTPKHRPRKRSAPPVTAPESLPVAMSASLSAPRLSQDPQSVAARERRHRISDRFKILKSMVPGGSQLDTVSMLDEAIHYVKYLKAQIWLHQHCNDAAAALAASADENRYEYPWSLRDVNGNYQPADLPPPQPPYPLLLLPPQVPPLYDSVHAQIYHHQDAHYAPNYIHSHDLN